MKKCIIAAAACAAAMTLAAPALWAKGDGTKENEAKIDSGLEASAKLAFEDVDEGSATDWGAASGGPELGFRLWSDARARMTELAWLTMGPSFEVECEIDTASISAAGEPYIAADGFDLRGLAGWGGDARFPTAAGRFEAGLSILAGGGIFDLSGADAAYLPSGADAQSFWFRVEPMVGADARIAYMAGSLELRARERYLATWEAETSSGIDWDPGFEELFEIKAIYSAAESGALWIKARAGADISAESRVIVPVLKYSVSVRGDLGWKGVGALKLSPLIWSYKAKVPDLGDFGARTNVERRLSGKVEWESEGKDAAWSLGLRFPWTAEVDGETASGEWELSASLELDL
jgi:hypothetical protein